MNNFAQYLNDFFIKYLTNQRNASANTIRTYRDTFVQLIDFMSKKMKIKANKLKLTDFNFKTINNFLDWIEETKNISVVTRNNRLAAIKSFFKYVSYFEPEYLNISSPIISNT